MAFQPKKYCLSNPFSQSLSESLTQIEHSTVIHQESLDVPEEINLDTELDLPILDYRDKIINGIRENKVIILTGSTGCGKTTQVPKFIIKDDPKSFNILVSQPRKIASITNATRVAQEMKCKLGSLVGFQVGLQRESTLGGDKTRVLYCTTGVILQKLIRGKSMNMYTHIILDEIHERDIEMDFLLVLIRNYLNTCSNYTKIILMSATMDANHFASYFRSESITVPIINMTIERNFEIEKCFLDQLNQKKLLEGLSINDKIINYVSPGISDEMMRIVAEIVYKHVKDDNESSILIFLPGLYEIESFEKALLSKFDVQQTFQIIVLHSSLTANEQKLAFKCDDKPKIILSTNIAENSVTIPKVNVVIDFCLTKYLVATQGSNIASLQLKWSSKTSSEQRAGRTGRVCDGIVYHLVSKEFYDSEMPIYAEPEMKRVPLSSVVLRAKLLTNEPPLEFLSYALDPPDSESVRSSVLLLKEVGALHRYDRSGAFSDDDGEVTFCGRVMASLPCDIYVAKFILLGHMFSVLKETVIIAAGLTINGSIFNLNYNQKIESFSQRLNWSNGSGSDLLAIFNAYNLWRQAFRQNKHQPDQEQLWCKKNNLDIKNLNEIKQLIAEFRHRLEESSIKNLDGEGFLPVHVENEKIFMLKVCIAGAWLPYYYLQHPPLESTERKAHREVGDLKVYQTIYFKDTEQQYSKLYDNLLKRAIVNKGICQHVDDMKVFHNSDQHKIYVTFTRETFDSTKSGRHDLSLVGSIKPEVYVALKDKALRRGDFKLNVMNRSSIERYTEGDQQPDFNQSASSFTSGKHQMRGVVTHVETPGKFFFQPRGTEYDAKFRLLRFKVKGAKFENVIEELQLTNGEKVVIRYKDVMERAIVKKTSMNNSIEYNLFDIGLITKDIPLTDVFRPLNLKQEFETPQQCFKCYLLEIEPSPLTCPQEIWTEKANEFFRDLVQDKEAQIEIFSVVDETVALKLFINGENINQKMIEERFAIESTEDYKSRVNHERRSNNLSFQSTSATGTGTATFQSDISGYEGSKNVWHLEPPPGMFNLTLNLSGPFSPLESQLVGVSAIEKFSIKIDRNSVNSILLNGNLESPTSRLYVAANVCRNKNGIILREVTMMPHIKGLAVILALMFCSKMILRCDEDQTRYTMLQTGLGCDGYTTEALLPLHDSIFPVNIQLTSNDLADINQLRALMSEMVFTPPTVDFPELNNEQKYELQCKIKNLTSKILISNADRNILPTAPMHPYEWIEDDLSMETRTDPLGNRSLFGLHDYPKLKAMPAKKKLELQMNLNDLKDVANSGNAPMLEKATKCHLCNVSLNSKSEVANHLLTVLHKASLKSSLT